MFSTFTVRVTDGKGPTRRSVTIDFTRTGWKQFCKVNANLGTRYIKAIVLKRELAEYIAAHEAAGVKLDTICQEVRYDDGICLLLMCCQGVWFIMEVFQTEEAVGFEPYYCWQQVKRGASYLMVRVLKLWRVLFSRGGQEMSA